MDLTVRHNHTPFIYSAQNPQDKLQFGQPYSGPIRQAGHHFALQLRPRPINHWEFSHIQNGENIENGGNIYKNGVDKLIHKPFEISFLFGSLHITAADLQQRFSGFKMATFGKCSTDILNVKPSTKLQICIFTDWPDFDLKNPVCECLAFLYGSQNGRIILDVYNAFSGCMNETPLLSPLGKPFGKRLTIDSEIEIKVIFEAYKLHGEGIAANCTTALQNGCFIDLLTGNPEFIEGNKYSIDPQALDKALNPLEAKFCNPKDTSNSLGRLLIDMLDLNFTDLAESIPLIFSLYSSKKQITDIIYTFINKHKDKQEVIFLNLMKILKSAPLDLSIYQSVMGAWATAFPNIQMFYGFAKMILSLSPEECEKLFSHLQICDSLLDEQAPNSAAESQVNLQELLKNLGIPPIPLTQAETFFFNSSIQIVQIKHDLFLCAAPTQESTIELAQEPTLLSDEPNSPAEIQAASTALNTSPSVRKPNRRKGPKINAAAEATNLLANKILSPQKKQNQPSEIDLQVTPAISQLDWTSNSIARSSAAVTSLASELSISCSEELDSKVGLKKILSINELIEYLKDLSPAESQLSTSTLLTADHLNMLISYLRKDEIPKTDKNSLFLKIFFLLQHDKQLSKHRLIWDLSCAALDSSLPAETITLIPNLIKQLKFEKKSSIRFIDAFSRYCSHTVYHDFCRLILPLFLSKKPEQEIMTLLNTVFEKIVVIVSENDHQFQTQFLHEMIAMTEVSQKRNHFDNSVFVQLIVQGKIKECWAIFFKVHPLEINPILNKLTDNLDLYEKETVDGCKEIQAKKWNEQLIIKALRGYTQISEPIKFEKVEQLHQMFKYQDDRIRRAAQAFTLASFVTIKYIKAIRNPSGFWISPFEGAFAKKTFELLTALYSDIKEAGALLSGEKASNFKQHYIKAAYDTYMSIFAVIPHQTFKFKHVDFLKRLAKEHFKTIPQKLTYDFVKQIYESSYALKTYLDFAKISSTDPQISIQRDLFFNEGTEILLDFANEAFKRFPVLNIKNATELLICKTILEIAIRGLSATKLETVNAAVNLIKESYKKGGYSRLQTILNMDKSLDESISIASALFSNPAVSIKKKNEYFKDLVVTSIESDMTYPLPGDHNTHSLLTLSVSELGINHLLLRSARLKFPYLKDLWGIIHKESPYIKPIDFSEFLQKEYNAYGELPFVEKQKHHFYIDLDNFVNIELPIETFRKFIPIMKNDQIEELNELKLTKQIVITTKETLGIFTMIINLADELHKNPDLKFKFTYQLGLKDSSFSSILIAFNSKLGFLIDNEQFPDGMVKAILDTPESFKNEDSSRSAAAP